MLEQPGDHACSEWNGIEWNDQGCLVRGMTVGGRTATCVRLLRLCASLQQPDCLHYITMQISIVFSFFLLFCIISLFDCMMLEQNQFCLCKFYKCISLH